jgi:hypothetical protein
MHKPYFRPNCAAPKPVCARRKAAYNNGEPERLGNEANYQRYLDRVERLKADVERAQADVDGLRRELARTGGGTTNTSTGSGTASPR